LEVAGRVVLDAGASTGGFTDCLLRHGAARVYAVDGTPEVKAGLTKQMLEGVSAMMAPRMKKGYGVTYLGELKQQGCRVYLWKLTYKDGGDDTLARLTLKEGKVAGFLLQ
jgi:hypothetical protein